MIALRSASGRRRALAAAGMGVVVLGAVTIASVNPFAGTPTSSARSLDNGVPTSTVLVTKRDLSSQTQVSATLGYADASTIAVPAGTAPSDVRQAQQAASSAQSSLETAQAALTTDSGALEQARATLAADRRKLAIDCSGVNAAESGGGSTGGSGGSGASAGVCATGAQTVATDEQTFTAASQKVQADQHAVVAATTALAGAKETLSSAQSSAADYGQTSVYTMLPAAGQIVRRGKSLYGISGQPVVLLYGGTTVWRAFAAGMSPGRDVAELNANLRALGDAAPFGNAFTAGTGAAIREFQSAHGVAPTGQLLLGSVVFEPGAVRVTSVTPTAGAAVQPGPVLAVSSTRRVVSIALDASQQTSVKVGDPVAITLPDNSTTPGHVSVVGTVATTPSSSDQGGGGGSSTPTIEVDVKPDRPRCDGQARPGAGRRLDHDRHRQERARGARELTGGTGGRRLCRRGSRSGRRTAARGCHCRLVRRRGRTRPDQRLGPRRRPTRGGTDLMTSEAPTVTMSAAGTEARRCSGAGARVGDEDVRIGSADTSPARSELLRRRWRAGRDRRPLRVGQVDAAAPDGHAWSVRPRARSRSPASTSRS